MDERTVLITGGTGTVGQVLIKAFFHAGYAVHFQYQKNKVRADQLSAEYGAVAYQWNLADPVPADLPLADVLVNNAAINVCDEFSADVPIDEWLQTLAVNLTAPFLLCQRLIPKMVERRWGRIINVSSIYGYRTVEGNLPYAVSKHGLRALTGTIAKEYFGQGITCNEICPGAMESELLSRIAAREALESGGSENEVLAEIAKQYPGRRLIQPMAIGHTAVFLASECADSINGISIPVDHGLTA